MASSDIGSEKILQIIASLHLGGMMRPQDAMVSLSPLFVDPLIFVKQQIRFLESGRCTRIDRSSEHASCVAQVGWCIELDIPVETSEGNDPAPHEYNHLLSDVVNYNTTRIIISAEILIVKDVLYS